MKNSLLLKHLATLGFIGYLPAAPGTWGSLVAVLVFVFVPMTTAAYLVLIAAVLIAGVVASEAAEKVIGEQDSGHIIIDEFAGMLVSMLLLPRTAGYAAAGFILFRFFDILKPYPIRLAEKRLKGGIGVMADDLLAGIGANLVMQVWKALSRI